MDSPALPVKPVIYLFVVAILTRALLLFVQPPPFPEGWGGEMSSVAVALSTGQGYSNPYWVESGPTALVPPVYPFLLFLIFRVFGIHTIGAAYAAYAVNILLSSLIVWPLARLGATLGGVRLALVAAFLWAIYPLSGLSEAEGLWSTSLYALLATLAVMLTVQIKQQTELWKWGAYGALLGLMVLTETVSVIIAGWSLIWLMLCTAAPRRGIVVAACVAAAFALAWLARNSLAFGQPVFLRSNFGLELLQSVTYNDLDFTEAPSGYPNRNPEELKMYLERGEIAYMGTKLPAALEWIRANPAQWLVILIRRYLAFWIGNAFIVQDYWFYGRFAFAKHVLFTLPGLLGLWGTAILLRQRRAEGVLLAGIFILYPVVYTLATTFYSYRLPIEPLLVLGASIALLSVADRVRRHWRRQAAIDANI